MKDKEKIKSQFDYVAAALADIRRKEGDKRSVAGVITCPKCGGMLRYSIARNGHVSGMCEGCNLCWTC